MAAPPAKTTEQRTMKLLKKTRAPSPSPSTTAQHPNPSSSADDPTSEMASHQPRHPQHHGNVEVSPQYLSLSIENSTLRAQLASLLDDDAKSTLELQSLLELANERETSLQNKVDELHAGLIEIERERKLLRGSVERERVEYGRMEEELGATKEELGVVREELNEQNSRAERLQEELSMEREMNEQTMKKMEDETVKALEEQQRYIKMKEKEISVLQIRVNEQERRIEVLVDECAVEKKTKEGLAREQEGLEHDLTKLKKELVDAKSEVATLSSEKNQGQIVEEALRNELAVVKQCLECERTERSVENERWNGREEEFQSQLREMEDVLEGKDGRIKELQDLLEGERVENKRLNEELQTKSGEVKELHASLDERERENHALKEDLSKLNQDMDRMSTCHEEVVSQYEEEIRILKLHNGEAEKQRGELEKRNQVATEEKMELSSKCDRIEQKRNDLLKQLTESKSLYSQSQAEVEKLISEMTAMEASHQEEKAHTSNIIASLEAEFESTREQVDQMQQCEVTLKQELANVRVLHAQAQEEAQRLKDQVAELHSAREGDVVQNRKCIAELEAELKTEVETSNALRLKVDELYLQWKQESDASQEAVQGLEEELATERKRHQSEVDSLQSQHRAQLEDIEKDSAEIITDLEESITSLKKEMTETKLHHDQATSQLQQKISQAHTENEILEHQIKENDKRAASQEETILQLTNLSQHRGEEMIVREKEIALLRCGIDKLKREHANAMEAVSNELDDARSAYERKTKDMQIVIEDLRVQLNAANEKLSNEDGDLNVAKSKLHERTNLLKEMVAQAKTYKADYEQESSRASQLNAELERCKSALSEAKTLALRCEQEKNEKEKQFWDAMREERDKRALMKKESQSKLQSFDEVVRKCSEMEKENVILKDKISRQESYIGRLHEKQADRRRSAAPLVSRANRPSTSGSGLSPPIFTVPKGASRQRQSHEARPDHRVPSGESVSEDYNQIENEQPAASKRATIPQSPSELDVILG